MHNHILKNKLKNIRSTQIIGDEKVSLHLERL